MKTCELKSIRKRLKAKLAQCSLPTSTSRFEESDVVQDAFLQIWMELEQKGDNGENVQSAWLRRIAIGHLCKLHRFNLAQKRSMAVEEELDGAVATDVSSDSKYPGRIAEQKETAIQLLEAVAELSDLARNIINLRFFQDYSYDAIAEELGMTRYHVCAHYDEAIEQLEAKLET